MLQHEGHIFHFPDSTNTLPLDSSICHFRSARASLLLPATENTTSRHRDTIRTYTTDNTTSPNPRHRSQGTYLNKATGKNNNNPTRHNRSPEKNPPISNIPAQAQLYQVKTYPVHHATKPALVSTKNRCSTSQPSGGTMHLKFIIIVKHKVLP